MSPSSSLLTHFAALEDPRTAYLVEHPLLDIIALTICAVICGAETWEDIEGYGQSKLGVFSLTLKKVYSIIRPLSLMME
jgi:predicted transposase YbfD/YdcC